MKWKFSYTDEYTPFDIQCFYNELSPSKKAHIDRMKRDADRTRSIIGDALIKQLLKTEFSIKNPIIERAENGQPYIKGHDIHISIAHSEKMVVCAAGYQSIGIDVEKIREVSPELIKRVCTEREEEYILCGDFNERFFEVWTAKEAYFKKVGTGITDLKSIDILSLTRNIFNINGYIIQII